MSDEERRALRRGWEAAVADDEWLRAENERLRGELARADGLLIRAHAELTEAQGRLADAEERLMAYERWADARAVLTTEGERALGN